MWRRVHALNSAERVGQGAFRRTRGEMLGTFEIGDWSPIACTVWPIHCTDRKEPKCHIEKVLGVNAKKAAKISAEKPGKSKGKK